MTTMAGTVRYGRLMEVKATDDGWGLEGLASTYSLDSQGDVVERGAFRESLVRRPRPPLLFSHKQDAIIGVAQELRETADGLHGRWKISRTQLGGDIRQLLLDGALTGLSIGYVPMDARPDGSIRRLRAVDLLEVSVVALPANEEARVQRVKATPTVRVESENARRCREILARLQASSPKSELQQYLARKAGRAETAVLKADLEAMRRRLRARGVTV